MAKDKKRMGKNKEGGDKDGKKIMLSTDQLPEISKWEKGNEYDIEMTVRQVSDMKEGGKAKYEIVSASSNGGVEEGENSEDIEDIYEV